MKRQTQIILAVCTLLLATTAAAQSRLTDTAAWAAVVQNEYSVVPNITYIKANNMELKLDVYRPRNVDAPTPTLIYIHGGGWVRGNKEANVLRLVPYLEAGWSVVNVQYRLGDVSLAPAAVEDCLCALRWVIRNAAEYDFDISRIVVTGNSAGGHLALTTGMLPADSGLDNQCPGNEDLSVAAIVNWYGITDVADLLAGENQKSYAVQWMAAMPDRVAIADRISPLQYVRSDLPPIITIHGDADPTVPYDHAVQLHRELREAGVINELITVPGGGHGGFPAQEMLRIYEGIFDFLADNVN